MKNLTNDKKNTREHKWHIHVSMYKFTLFYPWFFLIVAVQAHLADEAPLIRHVLSTVDPARYTNCYVCMYENEAGLGISN